MSITQYELRLFLQESIREKWEKLVDKASEISSFDLWHGQPILCHL